MSSSFLRLPFGISTRRCNTTHIRQRQKKNPRGLIDHHTRFSKKSGRSPLWETAQKQGKLRQRAAPTAPDGRGSKRAEMLYAKWSRDRGVLWAERSASKTGHLLALSFQYVANCTLDSLQFGLPAPGVRLG